MGERKRREEREIILGWLGSSKRDSDGPEQERCSIGRVHIHFWKLILKY